MFVNFAPIVFRSNSNHKQVLARYISGIFQPANHRTFRLSHNKAFASGNTMHGFGDKCCTPAASFSRTVRASYVVCTSRSYRPIYTKHPDARSVPHRQCTDQHCAALSKHTRPPEGAHHHTHVPYTYRTHTHTPACELHTHTHIRHTIVLSQRSQQHSFRTAQSSRAWW